MEDLHKRYNFLLKAPPKYVTLSLQCHLFSDNVWYRIGKEETGSTRVSELGKIRAVRSELARSVDGRELMRAASRVARLWPNMLLTVITTYIKKGYQDVLQEM